MKDDDAEGFLARWSRRKRAAVATPDPAAETEPAGEPEPPPAEPGAPPPPKSSTGEVRTTGPAPFDPTTLPPIESIGPQSDIRAFLQKGVPAELTRAALRRAWSSDLAIRDFIGLAENSWDFTSPGGVPGFGTITSEEVARILAALEARAAPDPSRIPQQEEAAALPGPATIAAQPAAEPAPAAPPPGATPPSEAAADEGGAERLAPRSRSRHGGALPS